MTLHVPFHRFAEAAERHKVSEVYVRLVAGAVEVTAALEGVGLLYARTDDSPEAVKAALAEHRLAVFDGAWSLDAPCAELEAARLEPYVAAVAYVSEDLVPGVWVDAFPAMPTQVQVLRSLYDEFRSTGELADVAFEEFVRLARPNVAIVSPSEILGYAAANEPGPSSDISRSAL